MAHYFHRNLLIITILCWDSLSIAQQYNFTRFSVEDGLAQSQVYSLLQDSRGYLWMGTRGGGVSCFNGLEFKNYTTKNGLPNGYVWSIKEDQKKNIWIGTGAGLVRFNGISFEKISGKGLEPNDEIRCLSFDQNNELWISTSVAILKFDGKNFKGVRDEEQRVIQSASVIFHDKNGNTWVGTDNGLLRFEKNGTITRFGKKEGLQNLLIRSLCEDNSGNIWIGTYGGGVFIHNGKKIYRPEKNFELRNKIIHDLYTDSKGSIWVCTLTDGIYKLNLSDSSMTWLSEKDGLSNNHVKTIMEDSWGSYWIGTSGGGVCKYSGQQFSHYSRENGLPGDFIHSVFVDATGALWTGVADKGICVYDSARFRNWSAGSGFKDVKIKSICYGPDSSLWLGTEGNGVFVMDSGTFWSIREFNGKFIRDMCRDADGNMWVATAGSGIYKAILDSTRKEILELKNFTTKNGLPSNRVNALHIDKINKVWFGTEGGGAGNIQFDSIIVRWDKDVGLVDNNVRSLTEDESGNLWIGTNEYGINVLPLYSDLERVDTIDTEDGLSSSNIYLLCSDKNGNMYVGSEKGIDVISLDPNGKLKGVRHLGKPEGFKGIETCQNAVAMDAEGNIWFGTVNGLTMLNPKTTIKNTFPPVLSITGINLFYESILDSRFSGNIGDWMQIKDRFIFEPGENHLGFEFMAVSLANAESVRYTWKLEGNDKEWAPLTGNRSVTYSNLSPGDYTFLVKAVNEDDIYSKDVKQIAFTILPPFWKTWWFITIITGSVILLLVLIFRIRLMQVKRRSEIQRRELQMEKDLLELEQKALRLQMNPHFIFNALNSIQGLISQKDDKTARFYLAKFSKLMRLILDNSRQSMITLRTEIMTLENYLSLEKFCSGDQFEFEILCEEDVQKDEVSIPPMMIQPFVENAVIHGMKHKQNSGKILVSFTQIGHVLECSITDNGVGRTKASEMNAQRDQEHKSTALVVTQERLDILNKDSGVKSLEIIDLYTDDQPTGTKVILRITSG